MFIFFEVKRERVLKARTDFLDMLSPNIDRCYDVKSKRLDVSLNVLFNEVTTDLPFLNF